MEINRTKESKIQLLYYTEAMQIIEDTLQKLAVQYMPVNIAYFRNRGMMEQNPEGLVFPLEYLIKPDDFMRVADSFDSLPFCSPLSSISGRKTYSVFLGKNELRCYFFQTLAFPSHPIAIDLSRLFSEGIHGGSPLTILPRPEDALILFLYTLFENSAKYFNKCIFNRIDQLIDNSSFSWEIFWYHARMGNIEIYAAFILSLYTAEKTKTIPMLPPILRVRFCTNPIVMSRYFGLPTVLRKFLFKAILVKKPARYVLSKILHQCKTSLKKLWSVSYIRIIEAIARPLITRRENFVFDSVSSIMLNNPIHYRLPDTLEETFLIRTSTGIWLLKDQTICQLVCGNGYGITRIGDRWYSSQQTGARNRIISFRIDTAAKIPCIRDMREEYVGLPSGIHQIDSFCEELFIVDTRNNRLIHINSDKKTRKLFPNPRLKKFIHDNSNHFNSVFITDSRIHVLAHNGTFKGEKNSEVYTLDKRSERLVEVQKIPGFRAHNIILFRDHLYCCNSAGGELLADTIPVFVTPDYFIRGLAITESTIAVGGSQFAERSKRMFTNAAVFLLDHRGKLKTTIHLDKIGQIYEIRSTGIDYSLSQTRREK